MNRKQQKNRPKKPMKPQLSKALKFLIMAIPYIVYLLRIIVIFLDNNIQTATIKLIDKLNLNTDLKVDKNQFQ